MVATEREQNIAYTMSHGEPKTKGRIGEAQQKDWLEEQHSDWLTIIVLALEE